MLRHRRRWPASLSQGHARNSTTETRFQDGRPYPCTKCARAVLPAHETGGGRVRARVRDAGGPGGAGGTAGLPPAHLAAGRRTPRAPPCGDRQKGPDYGGF